MKLATTSAAFASLFATGAATHLEWLEWCAADANLDGVVFAIEDFPRRDAEYLAQVKKIATDVGLAIVAIRDDALLLDETTDADVDETLALALALGAPYVLSRTGSSGDIPPAAFASAVRNAKRASKAAKRANVTIALRAAAGTVTSDDESLGYLIGHVDSAWLRIVAEPLGDVPLGVGVRSRTVIAYVDRTPSSDDVALAAERLRDYRGWLIVDASGDEPRATLQRKTRDLRRAFSEQFLTPTV